MPNQEEGRPTCPVPSLGILEKIKRTRPVPYFKKTHPHYKPSGPVLFFKEIRIKLTSPVFIIDPSLILCLTIRADATPFKLVTSLTNLGSYSSNCFYFFIINFIIILTQSDIIVCITRNPFLLAIFTISTHYY